MAVPGGTPGASEYSHGPGMFPNPAVDADAGRSGFPPGTPTLQDDLRDLIAYRRTNSADPGAKLDYEELGNPDRFGPGLPLVQTTDKLEPTTRVAEEVVKFERLP